MRQVWLIDFRETLIETKIQYTFVRFTHLKCLSFLSFSSTAQKMKFSINFLADLVKFTEEILNEKFFLRRLLTHKIHHSRIFLHDKGQKTLGSRSIREIWHICHIHS